MRVSEKLRAEAKRRTENGEMRMPRWVAWKEVADWLEEQPEDSPSAPLEEDVLAEALRAYNMRAHPDEGWEAATDQVKNLWRDRARTTVAEIEKIQKRRSP